MSSKHKIVILTLALIVSIMTTMTHCQELVTPLNINITVVNGGDSGQCPYNEIRERGFNETNQQVKSILSEYLESRQPDEEQTTELPTTALTTDQSVTTTTDPLYTCNGTPGWRQVVFINMTDTSYNCPSGLNLTSYSKRTCGRANPQTGCSSTTFSVGGSQYSQVCGRIRGYQVGETDAFYFQQQTIDGYYVIGASLTHGAVGNREHIWTFASGLTEMTNVHQNLQCPCDTTSISASLPQSFVGNDYFCESGLHSPWGMYGWGHYDIFLDDPLWDGQNCTSTSTCCQFNNPPWFTKTLPNPTTNSIELRICHTAGDNPLELIELYVQ